MVSLQELPKKIQYITIDSNFVNGTNNTFSFDLNLESNTHVSDINKVCGLKVVDFYITQVGVSGGGTGNGAKYIDIICDDIPKTAQILNERRSQIFARIPLERIFDGSNNFKIQDKQWKSFNRQTSLFNPISIQKLDFEMYEQRAMVHSIIEAPTKRVDFTALSKELQLGQKQLNELMDEVSTRLERQISEKAGHIIAGTQNSSLHWWLGNYKPKK